jgi:GNAT superfamily N-acetyltransferase
MRPLKTKEYGVVAELFARSFAEELWCAALVEALPSPEERHAFLLGNCRTDLEGFALWDGAFVVESARSAEPTGRPAGLILVGRRDRPTGAELDALNARAFEEGCATLSPQSRELLSARLAQMEALVNGRWMDRYCEGDFRYIYGICVGAAYRGAGIFGQLIDPLIAECDERGIPLCLECYAEHLTALYGSKGFEVVDTVHVATLELTQYRMVRRPR